jgi:hypothetical protein
MNLPKEPTLDSLTKEQLVYLLRCELFMRVPDKHRIASAAWSVEYNNWKARSDKNLEECHELTRKCGVLSEKAKETKSASDIGALLLARQEWLTNQEEYSRLQIEYDRLDKYREDVVMAEFKK